MILFERPEELLRNRAHTTLRSGTAEDSAVMATWITQGRPRPLQRGPLLCVRDTLVQSSARWTAQSLEPIVDSLDLGAIRHWILTSNHLGPQSLSWLKGALARAKNLESLWLGENYFSPLGAVALGEALAQVGALQSVWLGRAGFDARSLEALIRAWPMERVECVDWLGATMDARALAALCAHPRFGDLSLMGLDGCAIGERNCSILSDALQRPNRLRALWLGANRLGDAGLAVLACGLRACSKLEWLSLAGNGLTAVSGPVLASLLESLPSLRVLEVGLVDVERWPTSETNSLDSKGIRALCEVRTSLTHVDLRGNGGDRDSVARVCGWIGDNESLQSVHSEHLAPLPPELRGLMAHRANGNPRALSAALRGLVAPARDVTGLLKPHGASRREEHAEVPSGALLGAPQAAQIGVASDTLRAIASRLEAGLELTEAEQALLHAASRWAKQSRIDRGRTEREAQQSTRRAVAKSSHAAARARVRGDRDAQASAPGGQRCYRCRTRFDELDGEFPRHCPRCAGVERLALNQAQSLVGRVALVTGGRVRVGRAVVLSLLRAGAHVVTTTRFVADAWARFEQEKDCALWRDRLEILALDLRDLAATEALALRWVADRGPLDLLINNAAQTIARDAVYYREMASIEAAARRQIAAHLQVDSLSLLDDYGVPTAMSESARQAVVPEGWTGREPIDTRASNSWTANLQHVSIAELLSAHVVNVLAPYVLTARLRSALALAAATRNHAWVVQVSAQEGQFERRRKSVKHPHTNMAKAALNMLTRTSADDLARERIWMCSVDPGWVSAQQTFTRQLAQRDAGFVLPVREESAAARVLDPVYSVLAGAAPWVGVLLKDFVVAPW
ncbi:MAG: SDR family NAD(P)-dependent oxidoreductase [Deltaproteobacteria bacterium]|nr:SDR family NAD(P)-dependent oxidoreductase [Deltaproteobacteria bacterium]